MVRFPITVTQWMGLLLHMHTPGAFTPRIYHSASKTQQTSASDVLPTTDFSSSYHQNYHHISSSMTFWRKALLLILVLLIAVVTSIALADDASTTLTLKEAEHLGVSNHDLFANIFNSNSATDKEPEETKITFGVEKPPTNVTTYIHDPTNVYKVGVQQVFSDHDSYNSQTRKTSARHAAQQAQHNEKNQQTLVDIRTTWLELYYWVQAAQILQERQDDLKELSSTPSVETTLADLAEQQQQAKQKINTLRTKLGMLIGSSNAQRTLPDDLPLWPAPPALETMRANLNEHPKLQADNAEIAALRAEIALGKSDSDSSFALGASYGVRQDDATGTTPHPDMISASISMKMPAPAEKGIDRSARVNLRRLEAAQTKQETDYRNLVQSLNLQYAKWKQAAAQLDSLEQQEQTAQQLADDTTIAYQQQKTDLNTLLRAYHDELEVELAALRAEVDLAQARAALLYYES